MTVLLLIPVIGGVINQKLLHTKFHNEYLK